MLPINLTITIINLLLINIIMVLIHESGFITNIDGWVSEKWRFHHLPYPVLCLLCGTWWLSLLYIIIAGPFNLLTVALCLLNAHLTKITQPLCRMIENICLKLIEKVNNCLKL